MFTLVKRRLNLRNIFKKSDLVLYKKMIFLISRQSCSLMHLVMTCQTQYRQKENVSKTNPYIK